MAKRYQVRVRRGDNRYSYGYVSSLEEAEARAEQEEQRMDNEEKQGHIVGSKGEILRTRFRTPKGVLWDIIGTKSTGRDVFDAVDTVKKVETGEFKDLLRRDLYKMTRFNTKNNE
jgi:hypothetical protein